MYHIAAHLLQRLQPGCMPLWCMADFNGDRPILFPRLVRMAIARRRQYAVEAVEAADEEVLTVGRLWVITVADV